MHRIFLSLFLRFEVVRNGVRINLIHQPSSGTQGKITDQEIMLKEGIFLKKRLAEILAKNTSKKVDQIIKDMDRDNWMSADEAKDYGIIDEVIAK